jgi:hypothetical protein
MVLQIQIYRYWAKVKTVGSSKGKPSVSIGVWFNLLRALGLQDDFLKLAADVWQTQKGLFRLLVSG